MTDIIKFQKQVATGRLTLPVTILMCLLLWAFTWQEWTDLFSLCTIILIACLMIEANTTFTLIRTRTYLPTCLYGAIATSLFFLHSFEWENLVPLTFILALSQQFRSYESTSSATPIYHVFFFISLGSLIFPQFLFYAPLFWLSMIPFRSINDKSFFSCILGTLTPYWFLFGYAFCFDQMPLFLTPLKEAIHFYPIDYSHLTLVEILSWGFITLLLVVSGFHYWLIAYTDKTRTRIFHSFLIIIGLYTTLWSVLQPVHLSVLMPIQLICAAFLGGHLFTLTRNRFSEIFFIVTFAAFIFLLIYNLWMQYFNF